MSRKSEVEVSNGQPWRSCRIASAMLAATLGLFFAVNSAFAGLPAPARPLTGGRIAFTSNRSGNNDVYVMNTDGSGVTNLTNNPANDYDPYWSPDGTRLVFTRLEDGIYSLYVMNADGSGQTNLTSGLGFAAGAAWSPDGNYILFSGRPTATGTDADVYRMDANGANVTQLTNTPGLLEVYPVYSPDMTRIAYAIRDPANSNLADIFVMNADGSGVTNLTNNSWDDFHAAWSPDGAKIAFTSNRDGNQEIYTINPDGSDPTNLTNNLASDGFGNWSPDGTQFVFHSNRGTNIFDVYVMNADGSGQTNLTNNPAVDQRPAWGSKAATPTPTDTSTATMTTTATHTSTAVSTATRTITRTATVAPCTERVNICHRTGSPRRPYHEITVSCDALPAHRQHGDIYPVPPGGCPAGTPRANPSVFTDVDQSNPFYDMILDLYEMGAISGYSDGTFRWGSSATRAHLVKVVVLAFGIAPLPNNPQRFTDVPTNHPFFAFIEAAYVNGLISGYADNTFRPYNNMTRGQLCKVVTEAADFALLNPPTATFADVAVGSPFYTYVETAYANGVISGYSDGRFRPESNATRGQLSKIINLATHP